MFWAHFVSIKKAVAYITIFRKYPTTHKESEVFGWSWIPKNTRSRIKKSDGWKSGYKKLKNPTSTRFIVLLSQDFLMISRYSLNTKINSKPQLMYLATITKCLFLNNFSFLLCLYWHLTAKLHSRYIMESKSEILKARSRSRAFYLRICNPVSAWWNFALNTTIFILFEW